MTKKVETKIISRIYMYVYKYLQRMMKIYWSVEASKYKIRK